MKKTEGVTRPAIVEDDDDSRERLVEILTAALPDLDRSEVLEVVRAIDRIRSRRRGRFLRQFTARSVNKVYFIPVDHIDWIDAADNYIRLHAGGREHLVRGTISGILPRLDPDAFIRVNRGLIVSTASIVAIESVAPATYRLSMRDGARLTTSRSYVNAIRELRKALAG